jgi:hypothetical protein
LAAKGSKIKIQSSFLYNALINIYKIMRKMVYKRVIYQFVSLSLRCSEGLTNLNKRMANLYEIYRSRTDFEEEYQDKNANIKYLKTIIGYFALPRRSRKIQALPFLAHRYF